MGFGAHAEWNPSLASVRHWEDAYAMAARGRAVLRACQVPCPDVVDPEQLTHLLCASDLGVVRFLDGRRAVHELLVSLYERDAGRAGHAAALLLGRGPGLTPEGDDLMAGAAAVVSAGGGIAGFDGIQRAAWLRAACPDDAGTRSSWLSVTLLRLACEGLVAEPVIAILDPSGVRWRQALDDLVGVGSSTGLAYALAIGCAAVLVGRAFS